MVTHSKQLIPDEDLNVGASIRDVSGMHHYETFTITDRKTTMFFGRRTVFIGLKPSPHPWSKWINAEQIKVYFELV